MNEKSVRVVSGLESRPAALFVQLAGKFASKILIKQDDKIVNAKSIMGVLSLGVFSGDMVTIIAEGTDEDNAVLELTQFLSQHH